MTYHELMTQTGLGTTILLTLGIVGVLVLLRKPRQSRHTRTDPACAYHHTPTTRLGVRLYDRARGRACQPCMTARSPHRPRPPRIVPGLL